MALFKSKKDKEIEYWKKQYSNAQHEKKKLFNYCCKLESENAKLMSDGLRHKSTLAAKSMVERRKKGKNKI